MKRILIKTKLTEAILAQHNTACGISLVMLVGIPCSMWMILIGSKYYYYDTQSAQ